jgi:hypothetical protein
LESIGALTPSQNQAAEISNYQECVTLPVSRIEDANAVYLEDDSDQNDGDIGDDFYLDDVGGAIAKVLMLLFKVVC